MMDNSVKKQKISLAWVAQLMVLVAVFSVVLCGCGKKNNDGEPKLSMTGNNISDKTRKAKVTIKNEGKQELDPAATNLAFEAKITIVAKSGKTASDKDCKVEGHTVKAGSPINKPLKEIIQRKIPAGGTQDVEIEFDVNPNTDDSATAELIIKDGAGKKVTHCTVKLENIVL